MNVSTGRRAPGSRSSRDRPSGGAPAPAADRAGPRSLRRRPPAPARRGARSARCAVSKGEFRALMQRQRSGAGDQHRRSSARAALRSNGRAPACGAASAAPARASASPASSGALAATWRISSSLLLQCRIMSQPAAARPACARPACPQRIHRNVVAHQQALETLWSRESRRAIIVADVVAGGRDPCAVNTTWAVIAIGSVLSGRNAAKSVRSRSASGVSTTGSSVAVGRGPSVPRNMLQHRQDAAGLKPVRDGAGDRRHLRRLMP